jgi:SAM-dependent methyltransferase
MSHEVEAIRERYARRKLFYDPLNADRYMTYQEYRRALIAWIRWSGLAPVQDKRLLEIGCGSGDNLLLLLTLGFQPEHLVGNELLEERAARARRLLPAGIPILVGDAAELELPEKSFDVVFQSTVFTSILDRGFQDQLASHMWSLVKPGGGVLWYDFVFDNPRNPDVKGVSVKRIRELFPEGEIKVWKVTLAPPISRMVTKVDPNLYPLFDLLPFLRSHVLCWIKRA